MCCNKFGTSGHGRSPNTSSKLPSRGRHGFVAARGLVSCRSWAPGHVVRMQCSCNICSSGRRRSCRMRRSAWSESGGFLGPKCPFGNGVSWGFQGGVSVPLATEQFLGVLVVDVTQRFRWDKPALALCPPFMCRKCPSNSLG